MAVGDKRGNVIDFWMKPILLAAALLPCLLVAEEKTVVQSTPDYVRWVDESAEESLQTAVVRFTRPDGATVDLVGAVHIADKAYYQALNERFTRYDAVLYELVGGPMPTTKAEKEARTQQKETANLAWLGQMQQTMQRTLELTSQMTEVDYSPKNFVHADVTLEKFNQLREQKNESFVGLLLRAWVAQTEMQESGKMAKEPDLAKLVGILLSGDSATELKRIIGAEFDTVEDLVAGIEGADGTAIIGERNKVALDVLRQQLNAGKRKLAIFYGAAHLPDMEKRLTADGWKRAAPEWLKAWEIKGD